VSKGYASLIFRHPGVPLLGDDSPCIEVFDKPLEALQFGIATEDQANGFGFFGVNYELLVDGSIAEGCPASAPLRQNQRLEERRISGCPFNRSAQHRL
jgi:hypothetical protein